MKTYSVFFRGVFERVRVRARSNKKAIELARAVAAGREFLLCQGGTEVLKWTR